MNVSIGKDEILNLKKNEYFTSSEKGSIVQLSLKIKNRILYAMNNLCYPFQQNDLSIIIICFRKTLLHDTNNF
jgi:hypothetical protein